MRNVCIILVLFCHQVYGQDVRQPSARQGWIRIGQGVIASDVFFDSNGDRIPIRTNALFSTSVHGEYGLSNRFAVTLFAPVFVRTTVNAIQFNQSGNEASGDALNSFGDSEVGVRFKFIARKSWQAIGFVKLGIPLGKKSTVGTDNDLQTGDGEFNQQIGLQILCPLSNEAFFLSGYCAYNNRSENFSEEIRYGFSVTYYASRFRAMARINSIESLFNETAPVSLNGIFSNHREYISPGLELQYNITKGIGIFVSGDFYPTGRNTLAAPEFNAGLQFTLQ